MQKNHDKLKLRGNLRKINKDITFHIVYKCPVAWDDMTPVSDHVKYCEGCELNVFDLVGKSVQEVERLVSESGGEVCGQVSVREDNKILFGFCTRGNEPHIMRGKIRAVE